jgi:hypothetical protein
VTDLKVANVELIRSELGVTGPLAILLLASVEVPGSFEGMPSESAGALVPGIAPAPSGPGTTGGQGELWTKDHPSHCQAQCGLPATYRSCPALSSPR